MVPDRSIAAAATVWFASSPNVAAKRVAASVTASSLAQFIVVMCVSSSWCEGLGLGLGVGGASSQGFDATRVNVGGTVSRNLAGITYPGGDDVFALVPLLVHDSLALPDSWLLVCERVCS